MLRRTLPRQPIGSTVRTRQSISRSVILDVTDKVIKLNTGHYAEAGGFADVYRCQFKSGTKVTEVENRDIILGVNVVSALLQVAVKVFRFMFSVDEGEVNEKDIKAMHRELGIWKMLDHPNIVPFLGITHGFGRPGSASLVSLWMPNGTIRKFLSEHEDQLTLAHRLSLLLDIAEGLRYLHSYPIVHGDLSCNNVLVDGNHRARLVDFGFSSLGGEKIPGFTYLHMTSTRAATLRWAAPEHIHENIQPTTASDIYSFGNMTLFILSGQQPWSEVSRDVTVLHKLSQGHKPDRPKLRSIENEYWQFIECCWSSINERPRAERIVSLLQQFLHPSAFSQLLRGSQDCGPQTYATRNQLIQDSECPSVSARTATSSPTPTNESQPTSPPSLEFHRSNLHKRSRSYPLNVLVFGEPGAGKSSVINLIAGEPLAGVPSRSIGCPLDACSYDVILTDTQGQGHPIRLFDTIGVGMPLESDSKFGRSELFKAIDKANVLMCQLERTGGIALLLFVLRAGRMTKGVQEHHRLFYDVLCQRQVPLACVVTGVEHAEPTMDTWWTQNAAMYAACGLACGTGTGAQTEMHVCVTATRGLRDVYATRYGESQLAIREMLLRHVHGTKVAGWKPTPRMDVLGGLCRWMMMVSQDESEGPSTSKGFGFSTVDRLTRQLRDKCRFSKSDAEHLAGKIFGRV